MGLISEGYADELRNGYKWYVPLSGFEVDENTETPTGGGKASVRGPEWKQALGRQSRSANPLVNMIDQVYRTIERGERNRYLQALYSALKSFKPEELDGLARLDKGEGKRAINPKTGLVEYRDSSVWHLAPNAVGVKLAGRQHYMVFEDQRLADGVKRMSADQLGWFGSHVRSVGNFLKSLWTHLVPEFVVRHFLFRYPIEA